MDNIESTLTNFTKSHVNQLSDVMERSISNSLPDMTQQINKYLKDDNSIYGSLDNCRDKDYYNKIEKILIDLSGAKQKNIQTFELYKTQHEEYNLLLGVLKSNMINYDKSKSKLYNYKNNVNKDNTQYLYNKNSLEFINYIYYIILIIYYSIFVLFLIFSNFIKNQDYRNKKYMLLIILYLTIPILTKYILNIIYNIYTYYIEKYNLSEPKLSYNDIIKYQSLNDEHLDTEFVDVNIKSN
jgi:hypothetical protein|tara:strand:- start:5784 stop:6503 length:720 start_codon:yes stop_codon:yes gene_type:complete